VAAASPLGDSLGTATWPASTGCHTPLRITGKGKKGISPSEPPHHRPSWLGRGARRARRPTPAVPSSAHAPVNVARSPTREEKGEEERWVRLTRVAQLSARGKERKTAPVGWATGFSGLLGSVGPVG
jgi:hypothetical protein